MVLQNDRWPGKYKKADYPIYINLTQRPSDNVRMLYFVLETTLLARNDILHLLLLHVCVDIQEIYIKTWDYGNIYLLNRFGLFRNYDCKFYGLFLKID